MRVVVFAVISVAVATGQPFDVKLLDRLEWRAVGPANMGGRTTDVEGVPGNPNVVYVGTGGGGLWKTSNAGVTWSALFERERTYSVGDLALDPNNPEVVWLGTGEANMRNSVSFGDGMYKSTDGGKSWKHAGLRDTEHIARVVVHPRNPDTVFVCAVGHASGPNDARGVFVTTNGGEHWSRTLFTDNVHGCSDLDVDPENPNIVHAALWHFDRKPWNHTSGSEKGGLFRSSDGGRTWARVTGLPKLMGRIGVKVAPSNPNVVYAITESKEGTLYRSTDRGATYQEVSRERDVVSRGFYYADLRVDPRSEDRVYAIATTLQVSVDGGKTFRRISARTHLDYHSLWIDPKDPRRMWQGNDGGIAVSHDRGESWDVVDNIPLGQFYQIHADNRQPFYHIVGGLQDNGTWTGPSRTREPAGILNDDWRLVSFGDGFHASTSTDDPDVFITESQGGSILVTNLRTREQQSVSPQARRGFVNELKYRFNWNTPIVPSPHGKNTLFFGGNVLFQSRDLGRSWEPISPDLTTNDPDKLKPAGGPVWLDNSTAENYCTIISIGESPVKSGLIWAGTDDGNLQVTSDGGKTWSNVAPNVPGLPPLSPVSHVEPSRTGAGVAYVAFDRHLLDDFRPFVFRTTDGGRSWNDIGKTLPSRAYVHVVREDPKNPALLYAGTELGLYASWNGGANWSPLFLKNLPKVAVHDIVVHARENDLILGTHGRSIMILDDATPVQQMSETVASSAAHLFDIRPALRFATRFTRYGIGDRVYKGANPPYGALISYYLKDKADDLKIQILDSAGKVIRELAKPDREPGLHRTSWDLRYEGPQLRAAPAASETEFGGGPRGPQVTPGVYTVRLFAGTQTVEKKVDVRIDPSVSVSVADLTAQRDRALEIRARQSEVNLALKRMDSLKEQLIRLQALAVPDAAKEAAKLVEDLQKQIDSETGKLGRPKGSGRLDIGPRLAENLADLAQQIGGPNAAPTTAQVKLLGELLQEFREKMPAANSYFSRKVPEWNQALARLGLPGLTAWRLEPDTP